MTVALTALYGATAQQGRPPQAQNAVRTTNASDAAQFFETKVRPLLVDNCFSCHSDLSKSVQSGLKLDSRAGVLKGGLRGPSLVPGDPEHSLLLTSLSFTDKELKMPPAGKLKRAQIAILTAWVKMGAPWPERVKRGAVAGGASSASSVRSTDSFWAYQPPHKPVLPNVKRVGWAQSPIDRFLCAGLEAKGLQPASPADRRTLIRRATYDLTGLPPTPQEIRDFLNDTRPGAFARVVDRLLDSRAYGECWGRHWLDVARYADSNGVDENLVYASAWRYRDYVIRAFNQDKPIDRFIQEQIAGDLLPDVGNDSPDYDRIIATGYLSLGPKMLAEDDPVKQEEDIIDEQIDTLGKTFLGLTLGCARCHDHKFDPIPQTDYYALAGIFKSTRTMLNFKNMAEWQEVALAPKDEQERLAAIDKTIQACKRELDDKRHKAGEMLLTAARQKTLQYLQAANTALQSEGSGVLLRPVLEKQELPVPQGAILVEAEDFVRGNVLKDGETYGRGIGVLVNAGKYPNETEYELDVPEAGPYQLDLRYASGDPRPITLQINGTVVSTNAAGHVTGGFFPKNQQWFAEGVYALRAGKNLIRFERASYFPHIDKFLLSSRKGQPVPRTLQQIATEEGLVPEFLKQALEQVRKAVDGTKAELTFALPDAADSLYPEAIRSDMKRLRAQIQEQEQARPKLPRAMAVSEVTPVNVRVHLRGSYLTLGEECTRQFPVVLAGKHQTPIDPHHCGRLELARWLTLPENPLTARVFVNRVWRWHFGQGIVGSTDNFGSLGERPVNQALLDWLATTFVEDGWSLKKLHRRIMLSRSYQMSSRYDARSAKIDPENRLHWRNNRLRLEAEAVRDSILAVSGQLDRTLGGTLLTFRDREYVTSTANADPVNYRSSRRSVYLPVIRSALYDVYTAFDFGDPTVMNGDRPTTTVAPQALFMMNSALVLEQTKAMATALLAHQELDDIGRIQLAYETCYGRPAQPAEIQRARDFLQRLARIYAAQSSEEKMANLRAWQSLCKALVAANEFLYIE